MTSCRCGRNAFDDETCIFCGTGSAETAIRVLPTARPRLALTTGTRDRRPWTRSMVVAAIRRWHDEHGRTPRCTEWAQAGPWWPSLPIVKRLFGTWKHAIRAAGFEPPAAGRPARGRTEVAA